MERYWKRFALIGLVLFATIPMMASDCEDREVQKDTTGKVHQKHVAIQTDQDGDTVEQKNIARRITADNEPGAIKHLYLISPYTGDVLLYSSVKGKVTSGGKRLKPKTQVQWYDSDASSRSTYTQEVMNDDGTYGSSAEYLYFWDSFGTYHQVYTGAGIILISSRPLRVKKAVINIAPVQ
jgi:hypothetical protein